MLENKIRNIPVGRPSVGAREEAAVLGVLRSGWLTRGPWVSEFEAALCAYTGARHAIVVSSGTAGLHLACLAAGLSNGTRCWTTPVSFAATANAPMLCGAEIDFVDVDPRTANMDLDLLAKRLSIAESHGTLPHVVLPVHFAGQPVDMGKLRSLADRYKFRVIEDAAHTFGATDSGLPVGNCTHSDFCVLSFHGLKTITTGEGGAVLTNDDRLAEQVRRLRHNGLSRDRATYREDLGPWAFEQQSLGFNYWLSDIACSIGIVQLERIEEFLERRRVLVAEYERLLAHVPHVRLAQRPGVASANHLFVICLDFESLGLTRVELFDRMKQRGVALQVHYVPFPAQPFYQDRGFRMSDFPGATKYYAEAISLPLYVDLSFEDLAHVCASLSECLGVNV